MEFSPAFIQKFQNLEAIHLRHYKIKKQHCIPVRILGKHLNSLTAAVSFLNIIISFQGEGQELAVHFLVICHQHLKAFLMPCAVYFLDKYIVYIAILLSEYITSMVFKPDNSAVLTLDTVFYIIEGSIILINLLLNTVLNPLYIVRVNDAIEGISYHLPEFLLIITAKQLNQGIIYINKFSTGISIINKESARKLLRNTVHYILMNQQLIHTFLTWGPIYHKGIASIPLGIKKGMVCT